MLGDDINLLWGLHAFYNLLCGPSAILVNTNHRQMRADTVEHGHTGRKCALLEKLLDDLYHISNGVHEVALEETHCVAQPVRGKVNNLAIQEISSNLFDFFVRDRVRVHPLAQLAQLGRIPAPIMWPL